MWPRPLSIERWAEFNARKKFRKTRLKERLIIIIIIIIIIDFYKKESANQCKL